MGVYGMTLVNLRKEAARTYNCFKACYPHKLGCKLFIVQQRIENALEYLLLGSL